MPNDRPSHIAYIVSKPQREGDKSYWHEVGAVWPHGSGNGFMVIIHDQLSVSGRIVCVERREREERE